jgi:homoserine O-acetyltransferase
LRLEGAPFRLENGAELPEVDIRYAMYGQLNAAGDNALLVCHALSGSSRVYDWWPEMFGANGLFDTSRYCVIGTNLIGGCYGSTGPWSVDPRTGKPYGASFPVVTIRDMVRAQALALAQLGVRRLHTAIGGSVGGMQALQWAVDYPDRISRCIAIGTCPLPAMGLALNHLQRQAIQLDPNYRNGEYTAEQRPIGGLSLARQIAMISYKSAELFDKRNARKPNRTGTEDPARSLAERYDVAGYLDHQGEKFNRRFDANTYIALTKAMDTFELGRGYPSEAEAMRRVQCPVLLVGISTDWLFPCSDIRALRERFRAAGAHCEYAELASDHGHDGFLADMAQLVTVIRKSVWKDGPQAAWRMEASAD